MNDTEIELRKSIAEAHKAAMDAVPPPVAAVLKFFKFDHLPPHLQGPSAEFCDLACRVAVRSANAETTVALRKLLEAKDAAVRAVLP